MDVTDFHHRQQLPRPTGPHEPGVGGEVIGALGDGGEADENHGAGVEAFCFVDRGVADGVGRDVGLGDFAEVSPAEDAFVAERAAGDVGLLVEDEHFFRVAETLLFPTVDDFFDEFGRHGGIFARVGRRLGAFREMIATTEAFDHGIDGGVAVLLEEVPQRAGVADRGLEVNVGGLGPDGGEGVGAEA